MHRRTLLAGLATAATAGCLGRGGRTAGDETATGTGDATGTPPSRGTWDDVGTEAGKRPPASDAFEGFDCPSVRDTDRTVCYHTNGRDSAVVLSAYPEVFNPDRDDDTVEDIRFTLGNAGERTVQINPYDWVIHRRDGASWTQVAPEGPVIDPLTTVDPGETLRWALPESSHPSPSDGPYRADTALSPGLYAFSVVGRFSETPLTGTPAGTPTDRTAFVALFRLESPIGGAGETTTESTAPTTE